MPSSPRFTRGLSYPARSTGMGRPGSHQFYSVWSLLFARVRDCSIFLDSSRTPYRLGVRQSFAEWWSGSARSRMGPSG
jgi:hypothetical protein